MSGLDLQAIKNALADQITVGLGSSDPATVRPYRTISAGLPCVTMTVRDITYFGTFGPNGYAVVQLDLTITLTAADPDSAEIQMSRYLSVGTGNTASIADAVNIDPTLGGLVDSCKILEVGAPFDSDKGYQAVFPLDIHTKKVGAAA